MTVRIALLRAVNVGGRRMAMADLRDLAADLGYAGARTLLQSGNLVLDGGAAADDAIERAFEAAIRERFGFFSDVLVRREAAWRGAIGANPFPDAAKDDPAHLLLMPLKAIPEPGRIDELRAAITGPERVELVGRQLYLVYPEGIGTSRLTGAVIERRLGATGTARNWNTVLQVQALAAGLGA